MIPEYIKALPTGQETDFILVSCTGSGIEMNIWEQALRAKKAGEDSLRKSGLGYTLIRPGPLMEDLVDNELSSFIKETGYLRGSAVPTKGSSLVLDIPEASTSKGL